MLRTNGRLSAEPSLWRRRGSVSARANLPHRKPLTMQNVDPIAPSSSAKRVSKVSADPNRSQNGAGGKRRDIDNAKQWAEPEIWEIESIKRWKRLGYSSDAKRPRASSEEPLEGVDDM